MKPAPGSLRWDAANPPFDARDTSDRTTLSAHQVAERFIQLFYVEDNPADAFTCWMHPDYVQHNPNAPTGRDATLDPVRSKTPKVLRECQVASGIVRGVNPKRSIQDNVVIRERQELIALLLVPLDDHLRVIIAVAPKRMRVQIPLPPGRTRVAVSEFGTTDDQHTRSDGNRGKSLNQGFAME